MGWGILQIVVYVVLLALIAKPLGAYMAHVYKGERTFLHPVLRPVERLTYRLCGVDETREMGVVGLRLVDARLQLRRAALHLRDPATPGSPAAQPGARARHGRRGRVQHCGQLRDQHQLAGLRPGDGGELPHPDAGARARELRVGGAGHGRSGRVHPRPHAQVEPRARQLLGRLHAQPPVHPAAPLRRARAGARLARRGPEPQRAHQGRDGGRHHADDRPGPVRLAGEHQGTRHQRRRLLQRQLRAPIREPDSVHQPARDARAARDPRRPDVHVRTVRGQPAARAGRCSRPPWCCSC